jgi:hypothetical protein
VEKLGPRYVYILIQQYLYLILADIGHFNNTTYSNYIHILVYSQFVMV